MGDDDSGDRRQRDPARRGLDLRVGSLQHKIGWLALVMFG